MRQPGTKAFINALIIAALFITIRYETSQAADDAKAPAASQPATTAPVVIKWEDASKHVGETVTITGPVKGTHVTGDKKAIILNIGKDFPDPSRFTVMVSVDDKNPAKESDYKDKNITVTGKLLLYKKVPEIKAAKAADVAIEK